MFAASVGMSEPRKLSCPVEIFRASPTHELEVGAPHRESVRGRQGIVAQGVA
jgi:hypothetical protein